MSKQLPLCIYHANCTDGFGAAWAVNDWFRPSGGVELLAASYGDAPPDVTDREVFIVDFSYKRDTLLGMAVDAEHITVIDHHKTAQEDLTNLCVDNVSNVAVHFDMSRSGAVLAWKHFREAEPPQLLLHIQDRDLWQFKLAFTREVLSAVNSYEQSIVEWDAVMATPVERLIPLGMAIERKYQMDLTSLEPLVQRGMIAGFDVPVANVNDMFASDFGNRMLMLGIVEAFSATYYDTPKGRKFNLRSTDAGVDVSAIAKSFGGGGHRNAAGFFIPRNYADHAQSDLLSSGFLKG